MAIMYLWALIYIFHKEYPEKTIAISLSLNSILLIDRLIVSKQKPKPKHECFNKKANKKIANDVVKIIVTNNLIPSSFYFKLIL